MSSILKKTIQNKFSLDRFQSFTNELFNGLDFSNKQNLQIYSEFEDSVNKFIFLSDYKDPEKEYCKTDILVVELSSYSTFKRARTQQRNLIAKYLKQHRSSGAIVAFYVKNLEKWRISFVEMNLDFNEEGRVIREFTSAKRSSFIVGEGVPSHTPLQQFKPFLKDKSKKPLFYDIQEAFSVEKVTDEFFEEYRRLFHGLCNELNSNEVFKEIKKKRDIKTSNFAKKLLGQIVFLYFIQKKGWLGVPKDKKWGTGDLRFLRTLFEKDKKDKNNRFFNDYLEELFYNTLNKDRRNNSNYSDLFNCRIPYLNGGLFEPLRGYDWNETDLFLDDSLFSNKKKNGILDVFDRYNFTVREDDPLEKEVAVDPEMLGKVFENLLEEEERGKKGTFYTPREIVHYMCQESLTSYIIKHLDIKREEVKKYINNKEELNLEKAKELDKLLKNIKIIDPACGSGAFLVGMLKEIVDFRLFLQSFLNSQKNEYQIKNETIENCIHGVDIDSGAVEISKLRLWLSLIVDYKFEKIKPLPNLDFKIIQGNSLVNTFEGKTIFDEDIILKIRDIDLKIDKVEKKLDSLQKEILDLNKKNQLSTNKRQELFEEINKNNKRKKKLERERKKEIKNKQRNSMGFEIREAEEILKEFKEDIKDFYSEQKGKKELRKKINQLEWWLIENTLKLKKDKSALKKLEEYKKLNEKPFFLWRLWFMNIFRRENSGFDIVIANPPYGVREKKKMQEKYNLGSKDSYGIFLSHALKKLLRRNGILSFIVSDTWLTIKSHKKLREQVLEKQISKVIRLHQDCFDATVNSCVLEACNNPITENKLIAADLTNISTRNEKNNLRDKLYNLEKYIGESNPKFAVYQYPQKLIKTNSNLPIFVGSPKLFKLMNDTTCKTKTKEIKGQKVEVRQIKLNNNIVELVRLGDIAEIKVGLQTGDNKHYLYQKPKARGNYKNINKYKKFLLTREDLEIIRKNKKLRKKIIEKGFYKSKKEKNFDPDLWFKGKYIIPYDKGGESKCYYFPTNFYIDWSCEAVSHLLNNKKIRESSGKPYPRNIYYYFKKGITFSRTGYHATFRLNSSSVFDTEGSTIFPIFPLKYMLAELCSKSFLYLSKVFINHTVHVQVDELKEHLVLRKKIAAFSKLVNNIIKKQKNKREYDYTNNEQIQIDRLIYKLYELDKQDIKEIETWYNRRYSNLKKQ
jgi:hypothetical protein